MISFLQHITFAQPAFFGLFALFPLLLFWYIRKGEKEKSVLAFSDLSEAPVHTFRSRISPFLPLLRLLALACIIIALARPQKEFSDERIKGEGIDIVMAMDISSSMLAQDFQPDRLEVSKKVVADFIEQRAYDRLGLVVFAGEAFTRCPLTIDHQILISYLSTVSCGILEDGTAIGMGLATAINRLKDMDTKSKVVILLTDGVNNAGYIDPMLAAQIAKKYKIKVYTIGVGTTGQARSPIRRAPNGQYIFGYSVVEIDEDLLRTISEETGGKYYRATSRESLEQIYEEIDQLEKSDIEVFVTKRYKEYFFPFVAFALALLGFEALFRYLIAPVYPN